MTSCYQLRSSNKYFALGLTWLKTNNKDTTTTATEEKDRNDQKVLPPPHKSTATIIRTFLRDEILIGSTKEEDAQKRYNMALSKLKNDLK